MIRFFGSQNKDELESSGLEASDARLRNVEWKVNLILAIVAIQLVLTVLLMVRAYLIPSTTTIVLVSVALIAAIWFFRKQIPALVKRMLVRQFVGEDSLTKKSSRSNSEDSIK
ncbi:hypothetical protein [Mariniblastus fucicola]|uniref:Uncharacterized protein n=1 Tax=Mariniblastus fucicola TaxID=980251 RepID=A0A5B9P412_9BACT|nr:hypothetical protein [Mariniblastus fucicola]QEG20954.1 hypothetical protein MFFC18_08050 [Mariniblastus fucicola]